MSRAASAPASHRRYQRDGAAPDATFQDWQLGQLNNLYNALNAQALAQ
jgi:hypothetical protein